MASTNVNKFEDDTLFRAYVGPKSDYYLSRWARLKELHQRSTGFNITAAIFSGPWLLYRKMYRAAAMLFGIILVESVIEDLVARTFLSVPELTVLLTPVIAVVVGIIVGRFANYWYYRQAIRMVAKAKEVFSDHDDQVRFLSRKGGRSAIAAVVGCGIIAVVILGVSYVSYYYEMGSVLRFGENYEVFYSGDATEADARNLGTVLTEIGFFGASDAASVRIKRSSEGYTIWFVIVAGAWNEPQTVLYFEQLGDTVADSGFGRPLVINLCNEYFETQKTLRVE